MRNEIPKMLLCFLAGVLVSGLVFWLVSGSADVTASQYVENDTTADGRPILQRVRIPTDSGEVYLFPLISKDSVMALLGEPLTASFYILNDSVVMDYWEYMGRNKKAPEYFLQFRNDRLECLDQNWESDRKSYSPRIRGAKE